MRLYTRLRASPSPPPIRFSLGPRSNLVHLNFPNNFLPSYGKPIPRTSFYCNGLRPFSHTYSATEEENTDKLRRNLEAVGLNADCCRPGQYDIVYCPKCKGGQPIHRSLSVYISQNWKKNTEKVLHGLDDIAGSDEIIIVEGEIDKLSVEEAGFFNCVSVRCSRWRTTNSFAQRGSISR
ncbi:Primase homolog protein [Striga hermonthica]|uniref:Primase homolog protein n=1 Tax=Striga hermonthica TaxID=68872 RepID=A0A9N7NDU3_STRHE|nr:Primase homolog protein [Striga hermonthica]